MTAVPGTSPVTRPVCEIDATLTLFVVQTAFRPPMAVPWPSYGVATRSAPPATYTYTLSGAMRTLDTRGGTGTTVTVATADLPSDVAAMSTLPALTPVTTPLFDTVAIAGSAVAQTRRRSVSTFPATSLTSAMSAPAVPATSWSACGVTTTDSTGVGA